MLQEENDEAHGAGQRREKERLLPPQRVLRGLRDRSMDTYPLDQFDGEQHVEEGGYHEYDEELLVHRWKEEAKEVVD